MIGFDNIDYLDDESEELTQLDDLFYRLDIDEPTSEQLYEMYGVFLRDFVNEPIIIKGKALAFNKGKSKNPLCPNKYIGFEHIISRKSSSGKRVFDRERANKIHWIKPIINNAHDHRIKYFEEINDKGYNQLFYWYEEKEYVVILRELNPNIILITSFSVDTTYKISLEKSYNNYINL